MRVCDGLLKKQVKGGALLIGGQILDSRSSAVIEIYKEAGFDFVLVDREHTSLSDETIADHVRVARCLSLPCLVRVAEDCYHELNRSLDQAPDGIFVPRIRSRGQVEEIVRTIRYKPEGIRGLSGSGGPIGKYRGWDSPREHVETVNRNTVLGIQIETAEALADLDGILSVKGVDVALVGNDDLSLSMGMPGEVKRKDYIEAVEGVISACNRHGVLPGTAVADTDTAVFWIKRGMRFIWYSSDIHLLYFAAVRDLSEIRGRSG